MSLGPNFACNPAPWNKIIAKACLAAWHKKHGSHDPRAWSGSLSQASPATESPPAGQPYADGNLIRGIQGNSGRDALLTLEEILRSRKPAQSPKDPAEGTTVNTAT